MLLALLLYAIGLYLASYPDPHHPGYPSLTRAWACLCAICIVSYILLSDDFYGAMASDLSLYYQWYEALARNRNVADFEPGFYILAKGFASISIPFAWFLSAVAVFIMLSVYLLVRRVVPSRDTALVLFLYFNFFALYNVMFNVIRSGMSLACILLSIVLLTDRRFLASFCLIVIAASFHRSGIAGLLVFLSLIGRLSVWHLAVINLGLFAGSTLGVNEVLAGKIFMHLGWAASSQKWDLYTNPFWETWYASRNRVDFLIFTMTPFVLYVARMRSEKFTGPADLNDAHWLMKIYLLLMLPFSFFAFMPFSDRYALLCWILWPVVTSTPLLYWRALPPMEQIILRLCIVAILAGTPNILQYMTTLFSVSVELQDTVVGTMW